MVVLIGAEMKLDKYNHDNEPSFISGGINLREMTGVLQLLSKVLLRTHTIVPFLGSGFRCHKSQSVCVNKEKY